LAPGFEVGVGSSQSLIPIPADISQHLLDISEAHLCQMGAASLGLVEGWTRYPDLSGCATVPLKLGQAASDAPRKHGLAAHATLAAGPGAGVGGVRGGAGFVTRSRGGCRLAHGATGPRGGSPARGGVWRPVRG